MPKKSAPRTATAASLILQQAATPDPEPVEVHLVQAETPDPDEQGPAHKPAARGARAGLKQGEIRITCIFSEDQNRVLHDWAKTTGRTFREVTIAMAERYINETIRVAADEGLKLRKGDKEPPEAYADLYGETPDMWARFFE